MAVSAGAGLLRRLIAERTGLDVDVVAKVLEAEAAVTLALLDSGMCVKALDGAGYFDVIERKATRRAIPSTGELIEVPPRKQLVFRESKKKNAE